MRILLIEDEQRVADSISKGLKREGYAVDNASDGMIGEELAETNEYDAIILDIMLPRQDGWLTCANLRKKKILIPILMLTALDDVTDKIKGLDQGADDYLPKPFHFGELLARLRSLMRRSSLVRTAKFEIFGVILDQNLRKAYREGNEIPLSAKEFSLLELFMLNPDKIITRNMISEHLWDMNFDPQSNVIDSFVRFLRQKIDKEFDTHLIHTVRGSGYLFSDKGR